MTYTKVLSLDSELLQDLRLTNQRLKLLQEPGYSKKKIEKRISDILLGEDQTFLEKYLKEKGKNIFLKEKLRMIQERQELDERLELIIKEEKTHNKNSDDFYSQVIDKSLEYFLKLLSMDYAEILIKKEGAEEQKEYIPVHYHGDKQFIKPKIIEEQIKKADDYYKEKNTNIYIDPSDSQNGGVDAIFNFVNPEGENIGYLLLDDRKKRRILSHEEMEKICQVFYEKFNKILSHYILLLLKKENKDFQYKIIKVMESASTDGLTKLLTRKVGDEMLGKEIKKVLRHNVYFSILFFDIDFFKRINDTYGHGKGDEILRTISKVLKIGTEGMNDLGINLSDNSIHKRRESDFFYRYGGEEIVGVLPMTDLKGGMEYAEKIRKIVESIIFKDDSGNNFYISVSIGITCIDKGHLLNTNSPLIEFTVGEADKALYEAKHNGRNRVIGQNKDVFYEIQDIKKG